MVLGRNKQWDARRRRREIVGTRWSSSGRAGAGPFASAGQRGLWLVCVRCFRCLDGRRQAHCTTAPLHSQQQQHLPHQRSSPWTPGRMHTSTSTPITSTGTQAGPHKQALGGPQTHTPAYPPPGQLGKGQRQRERLAMVTQGEAHTAQASLGERSSEASRGPSEAWWFQLRWFVTGYTHASVSRTMRP